MRNVFATFSALCAVALLLLGGGRASAQQPTDGDLTRGWEIKAGFFIPERGGPRTAEGDVWFSIGGERAFYQVDRYKVTVSIDYYGSGKIYNVPITVNLRGNTGGLRYGVGAGVGISHDLTQGILGFSYNLMVGYTLVKGVNPVTFDIRYQSLSTGSGALNGFQFTLGYSF